MFTVHVKQQYNQPNPVRVDLIEKGHKKEIIALLPLKVYPFESSGPTVKILKLGTPEIITIIVVQLEQLDFTLRYCV